jgi:ketosteroid isomerase-like protein
MREGKAIMPEENNDRILKLTTQNTSRIPSIMTSKLLDTARAYIGHFATLDTEILEAVLAENFAQQIAPTSVNISKPYNKQTFIQHIGHLREIMAGFPVTAKEYVVGENTVTVWATSQTFFRDEAKDDGIAEENWIYEGEYMFVLYMDTTGEKIVRVVEFVDSKKTDDQLRPLMKRAKENLDKRTGV